MTLIQEYCREDLINRINKIESAFGPKHSTLVDVDLNIVKKYGFNTGLTVNLTY